MLSRIHSIVLLFVLLIGAAGMNYVQAQTSGSCGTNVTWSLNTSTGRLTISGSGAMTNWEISSNRPPWYASYREQITSVVINSGVTTIGKNAFCGCTNLTSVTIPNTVTTIYDYAFEEDAKLTSITIPNSVTYIGYYAFWLCSGLRTVTMSNKVKTIQGAAFSGCSSLTSITLPNTVTTLGIGVFRSCTSLTSVNIPTGLTALRGYTFEGCTALTSIVIPANIKSIGGESFSGCSALTSVTLPNTLTTMETGVFLNCTSLTSVNIPTGLTTLPANTFQGCSSLASISIPANIQTIGTNVFKNCNALLDVYVYWTTASAIPVLNNMLATYSTRLHVPCGTTSIYAEKSYWGNCKIVGNTEYTITGKTNNANGTVSIDGETAGTNVSKTTTCEAEVMLTATPGSDCRYAFIKWTDGVTTNPRTVTVSGNATYTAQFGIATPQGNCGANGNNLTWSLNRCTGVLTISGSGAMKDWSAETDVPWYIYAPDITSVVLPVGLTHIGANAFYGCAMTKIDIPAAVRTFGTRAFQKTSLRELYIPEGVTAIPEEFVGANLRSNAAPLERIYLPSTLTTLGGYSLSFTRLRTLTIPKSVTNSSIGIPWNYAYTPFTNIYASWTENVPQRGGRTEARNPNASKMHVPYGTKSLYTGSSAAAWSYVCSIVEDVDERAIDLGLSIRWASCNIGATAPEENGNFYAWGDTLTRSTYNRDNYPYSGSSVNTLTKYCTRAGNGTVDNRSTLLAFDDAAYINWGETWRMPTWAEWNELITQCIWKDTTYNDVHVWQVTGPNGNSIYLPVVGYMNTSTLMPGCYYWSSSLNTADSNDGCNRALYIDAADRSGAKYCLRQFGMPVRAVYRREWPSFTLTITDTPDGTTYTKAVNAGSSYTLTAQEDACRPFVRWSDGNTENPRTVTVTEDATYTAVYDRSNYHSGTCGAQGNNVRWALCDGVLTITGTGEMANWSITTTPWKSYKTDITTVSIEDGVTSIGTCAFYGCSNLTSVTIGTSVTTIKESVFAGCTSLTSITFPNSVTSIGQGVCNGCVKLTSVVLPDGLKNIPSYAFKDCFSLPSITIPDGVEFIRESAFNYCKALQSVTIPSSVIYIYAEAFRYCSALKDIYVSWTENIPYWPPDMTSNSDITLHVPCEAIELYNAAYGWKDYTIEGEGGPYTVTVTTNDASMGMVQLGTAAEQASFTEQFNCGEEITITAIPANGYAFDQWSDNSYQASRTIMLTSDTTLTALFKQSVYPVEHGALPGVFSVSDTKKVVFSQGNLQFNAALGTHQRTNGTTANGTWRFAENQYDFVGDNTQGNVYYNDEKCSNERVSNSYNGWIDYFNHGNTGYSDKSPTSYTTAFGMNFNSPSVYDWGSYVAISNGGNMPGYYIVNGWIVLQRFQWNYLFNSRANAQDLRSLATVNDVLGCILLPDDWQLPSGIVFTPDESSYATNTYTREQWNRMEQAGAVFLPAAGRRDYDSNGSPQLSYPDIQTAGYVWSSSGIGNQGAAVAMSFGIDNFALKTFYQGRNNYDGLSVRLAQYVSSYHVIFRGYKDGEENVVLQDKLVAEGAMPIPPEVPEDDCRTFIGWDRVIEPASGDTEYIAQYELKGPYTVTVTTNDASMGNVSIIVN